MTRLSVSATRQLLPARAFLLRLARNFTTTSFPLSMSSESRDLEKIGKVCFLNHATGYESRKQVSGGEIHAHPVWSQRAMTPMHSATSHSQPKRPSASWTYFRPRQKVSFNVHCEQSSSIKIQSLSSLPYRMTGRIRILMETHDQLERLQRSRTVAPSLQSSCSTGPASRSELIFGNFWTRFVNPGLRVQALLRVYGSTLCASINMTQSGTVTRCSI